MEVSTVERNLIRPYFGQAEKLMAEIYAKATFEIELASHSAGVVGQIPAIDALIRACGFSGAQTTLSITSLTQTGGVATATIGTHTLKVGDKVSISGASPSAYNGTQTITAVTSTTFDYSVTGSPTSPATGTPVVNSAYVYTPISQSISSVTMYYNVDGVLHKITGAKGTFSIDLQVKNIPKLKFEFTGINNGPADVAQPTPDFSKFSIPQVSNTQNTTGFSLFGYSGALESLSLALNNSVQYITLIGKQYADVLDRKVNGSMSFEAPTVAAKDFWTSASNQQTGALAITHGSQNGNKVSIACPRVLLDSPKYKESNNVMFLSCGVSVMPVTGNDEMTLTFA
jgi:hypothetical protein